MKKLTQLEIDELVAEVRELLESEYLDGCIILLGKERKSSFGISVIHSGDVTTGMLLSCQQALLSETLEAAGVVDINSSPETKTLPSKFVRPN